MTFRLVRNVVTAATLVFASFFLVCIVSAPAVTAAEMALLPTVFGAPFVGGLFTVLWYTRSHAYVPSDVRGEGGLP